MYVCVSEHVCMLMENTVQTLLSKSLWRAGPEFSHENTLLKSLLSLRPWTRLREVKITAFAGHFGTASPIFRFKLLSRSVSRSRLRSPLRLVCSFPTLSHRGMWNLGAQIHLALVTRSSPSTESPHMTMGPLLGVGAAKS